MPHSKLLASFIQSGNVMERMRVPTPPPAAVQIIPLPLPFANNGAYLGASTYSNSSPPVRATVVSRNDSGAGSCDNSDCNHQTSDGLANSSAPTTSGLARYTGGGLSLYHPNFQRQQQQQQDSPAAPNNAPATTAGHSPLPLDASGSNTNLHAGTNQPSYFSNKQPSPHSVYTYHSAQQLTPSNTVTTMGSANLNSFTTPDMAAALADARALDPEAFGAWDHLSLGHPSAIIAAPPTPPVELSMPSAVTTLDAIRHPTDNSLLESMQQLTLYWHPFCYENPSLDEVGTRAQVEARYLPLFALEPPAISVEAYLKRLIENMRCSSEAYIYALCLIHKISRKGAARFGGPDAANGGGAGAPTRAAFYKDLPVTIPVTTRSIHRLLLTALVVAAKMRDDKYYSTAHYANVGGVGKEDLLTMESTFLQLLGFDATVRPEHYCDMVYSIRQHCSTLMHLDHVAWAGPAWAEIIKSIAIPSLDALKREMTAQAEGERAEWNSQQQRKAKREQQQRSQIGAPLHLLTLAMAVNNNSNSENINITHMNNISTGSISDQYVAVSASVSSTATTRHHQAITASKLYPASATLMTPTASTSIGYPNTHEHSTTGIQTITAGKSSLPTFDVNISGQSQGHHSGSYINSSNHPISRFGNFLQPTGLQQPTSGPGQQPLPPIPAQVVIREVAALPGSSIGLLSSGSSAQLPALNGSGSEATNFSYSVSGNSGNSCSVNHASNASGSNQQFTSSSVVTGVAHQNKDSHHHPSLGPKDPQPTNTNPVTYQAPPAAQPTNGGFVWGVMRHPSMGTASALQGHQHKY
eukprot:GILI01005415.1.p1 GENE.GILI01005415.1~~GILI01005415.1.p1  ORF type:complete len:809 (+),score=185.34 GILI01005415.1:784-3210(+)